MVAPRRGQDPDQGARPAVMRSADAALPLTATLPARAAAAAARHRSIGSRHQDRNARRRCPTRRASAARPRRRTHRSGAGAGALRYRPRRRRAHRQHAVRSLVRPDRRGRAPARRHRAHHRPSRYRAAERRRAALARPQHRVGLRRLGDLADRARHDAARCHRICGDQYRRRRCRPQQGSRPRQAR